MKQQPKRQYFVDDMEPGDSYKLGTGLTVPRPIGWIGTVDADGNRNLAPYSFFNMMAIYPPTFVVAPLLGPRKDTLANLQTTGEFTVNIVTEETVEAMNASAQPFEADVDEFEAVGLTPVPSETIAPYMVGEATANFECVVTQMIPVGQASDEHPGTGMLVIGEATRIHVAERVVDDNFNVDQVKLRAVGRHVGGQYSRSADSLFTIDRPT